MSIEAAMPLSEELRGIITSSLRVGIIIIIIIIISIVIIIIISRSIHT